MIDRMLKLVVLGCLVALAVATPVVVRSKEEIDAFRAFLENSKTGDDQYLTRLATNPKANIEELSGHFEGDIILDDWMIDDLVHDYVMGRNAYTWPNTHWPHKTVVWEFGEGEFDEEQQEAILKAMTDIEHHTCVRFRPREPHETVFVNITGGSDGCSANVGYSEERGVHTLNLARNTPGVGCFRHPTIVHEFMHILGFQHMQSTYNRGDYVKIVEENLIPGTEHNFNVYASDEVSNLGVEYDYTSCMHYGPFAFSENGNETIIALKEHEGEMGQRKYITDKDWLRINRHYNCLRGWPNIFKYFLLFGR